MKLKKFSLVIMAIIVVAFSANVLFVHAAEYGAAELNFIANGDGTTATVTGYSSAATTEHTLTIPKTVTIDGSSYTVTAIAKDAFKGASLCTAVTIPDSVTAIGEAAFNSCAKLVSVNISTDSGNISDCLLPPALETIGSSAFKACTKLATPIVIPSTLDTLPYGVFYDCHAIPSLTISEGVSKIEGEVFYRLGDTSKSITTITMPSTLTDYDLSAINGNYTTKLIFNTPYGSTVTFTGTSTKRGVDKWDGGTTGGCLGGNNAKNGYAYFYSESIALLKDLQKALESSFNDLYVDTYLSNNFIYGDGDDSTVDTLTVGDFVYSDIVMTNNITSSATQTQDFNATLNGRAAAATELYEYSCESLIGYPQGDKTYYFAVTKVGDEAFRGDKFITNFKASDALKSLGDSVFRDTTNLVSADLGSITSLHYATFAASRISYIVIPASVTQISSANFPNVSTKLRYIIYEGDVLPSNWIPNNSSKIAGQLFGDAYIYVKKSALDAYNTTNSTTYKDGDTLAQTANSGVYNGNVVLKVIDENKPIVSYFQYANNYRRAFVYNPTAEDIEGIYIAADCGMEAGKASNVYLNKEVIVKPGEAWCEDTAGFSPKQASSSKPQTAVKAFFLDGYYNPMALMFETYPW